MKIIATSKCWLHHFHFCQQCGKGFIYSPINNFYDSFREYTIYTSSKYCCRECEITHRTRICPICKKSFLLDKRRNYDKTYCSKECFYKTNILQQCGHKLWAEGGVNHHKRRPENVPDKHCEGCGKVLKFRDYRNLSRFNEVRYCSNQCSLKHRYSDKQIACPQCKKMFYPKNYAKYNHSDPDKTEYGVSTFCSRKCFHAHTKAKLLTNCDYCGKEYYRIKRYGHEAGLRVRNYCSRDCFFKATKAIRNKTLEVKHRVGKDITSTCINCGNEFIWRCRKFDEKHNTVRKYCSRECFQQYRKSQSKSVTFHCLNCNAETTRRYRNQERFQFCGSKCAHEYRIAQRVNTDEVLFIQVCKVCGKRFKPIKNGQVHCSSDCYLKAPE